VGSPSKDRGLLMRQRRYRCEPNGEALPIASITVWKPGTTADSIDGQVDGLLDTGSAFTFIPVSSPRT
jgi:hypothetical protein